MQKLGFLALAVVQAGAYICVAQCGLARYLELYQEHQGGLLEEYQHLAHKVDDYE
jgi:hypothetical protein